MKAFAVCFALVLALCSADFMDRAATPAVSKTEVKSGLVVIQAMKSPGVVCDEGNGAAAAAFACGGKAFKSMSAGGDTDTLLQDLGIEFGIKLDCDGASDWSGCTNNGMGGPSVCTAFVGCA